MIFIDNNIKYSYCITMNKATVKSQIVSEITKRIRCGDYASGTLLPQLLTLAAEFHTSSTTISQALNIIRKKVCWR